MLLNASDLLTKIPTITTTEQFMKVFHVPRLEGYRLVAKRGTDVGDAIIELASKLGILRTTKDGDKLVAPVDYVTRHKSGLIDLSLSNHQNHVYAYTIN